jgi:hypothetical protein
MAFFGASQHYEPDLEKNYDADISTLARLIEEGKL